MAKSKIQNIATLISAARETASFTNIVLHLKQKRPVARQVFAFDKEIGGKIHLN
jgi:hypothetical protein